MMYLEFAEKLQKNFDACMETVKKKNEDYAKTEDVFANFRGAEFVGLSVEQGIVVRMMDKMSRISRLMTKEAAVKEESVKDTLLDLINYTNILAVYLEQKR